eukprot:3141027-Rhodomonas_salina.2
MEVKRAQEAAPVHCSTTAPINGRTAPINGSDAPAGHSRHASEGSLVYVPGTAGICAAFAPVNSSHAWNSRIWVIWLISEADAARICADLGRGARERCESRNSSTAASSTAAITSSTAAINSSTAAINGGTAAINSSKTPINSSTASINAGRQTWGARHAGAALSLPHACRSDTARYTPPDRTLA